MTQKRKKMIVALFVFAMLAGIALYCEPLGQMFVTVKDSKGQPIPDAKVTLKDTQIATSTFTIMTKNNGLAVQNGLKNHVFEVTVEKSGYSTVKRSVKIPAGLRQEEEFTLLTEEETLAKVSANDPHAGAIDAFNKAAPLINEKKYDEALELLKKSVSLDPGIFQTNFYLGVVYYEKGNYNEALQALLKAIELKNSDAASYRLAAACYEKLGNKQEMEKYTKLAQEKGGKSAIDVLNDGISAYNANDTDKAIPAFQKTIEMDPKIPESYYFLGMCYLNKGNNDLAIANLKKYLEIDPKGKEAETAKSILDTLK